jgi:hypothetical protein
VDVSPGSGRARLRAGEPTQEGRAVGQRPSQFQAQGGLALLRAADSSQSYFEAPSDHTRCIGRRTRRQWQRPLGGSSYGASVTN